MASSRIQLEHRQPRFSLHQLNDAPRSGARLLWSATIAYETWQFVLFTGQLASTPYGRAMRALLRRS